MSSDVRKNYFLYGGFSLRFPLLHLISGDSVFQTGKRETLLPILRKKERKTWGELQAGEPHLCA